MENKPSELFKSVAQIAYGKEWTDKYIEGEIKPFIEILADSDPNDIQSHINEGLQLLETFKNEIGEHIEYIPSEKVSQVFPDRLPEKRLLLKALERQISIKCRTNHPNQCRLVNIDLPLAIMLKIGKKIDIMILRNNDYQLSVMDLTIEESADTDIICNAINKIMSLNKDEFQDEN